MNHATLQTALAEAHVIHPTPGPPDLGAPCCVHGCPRRDADLDGMCAFHRGDETKAARPWR